MIPRTERSDEATTAAPKRGFAGPEIGIILAALGSALGLWGGWSTPHDSSSGYGIIAALPPLYWLGVALAVLATAILLRSATEGEAGHAAVVPFIWLILLHTAPALGHEQARVGEVWDNLGLVAQLAEAKGADVVTDARFAWPGFYGTFVSGLSGLDSSVIDGVMRLWPTFITGSVAIFVAGLARRAYPTLPLVSPLSALAYVLLAWTGHDNFSPRSVGLLLFVAVLVILESGPLRTGKARSASVPMLSRFAVSGDRPASQLTTIFVILVILGLGATVTHPPTFLITCLALAILGLYGRSVASRLLLLLAIAGLAWLGVVAYPVFADEGLGSAGELFGDHLTDVGTNDVIGSPAERRLVANTQLYFVLFTSLTVVAAAVAMSRERFRHLRPAVPLIPLVAVVPVSLVVSGFSWPNVTQAFTFLLPVAAVVFGRLLGGLRVRDLAVVVALAAAVISPLFLLARYGDDSFEQTSAADRAAFETAYARARGDKMFVADNSHGARRDGNEGSAHA